MGEQKGKASVVRDQKGETHTEIAGETQGLGSDAMGWPVGVCGNTCIHARQARTGAFLQRRGDFDRNIRASSQLTHHGDSSSN